MKKSFLLSGCLFLATNSFAASYTVTQLTNNNYYDEYARLNERGDVVWAAWVDSADPGWTVFEYNAETKTTTQISDNNAFYNSHQVNNRGDVVWMASDGHDQEIYLYQAETQSVIPLTNNDNDDTNPQISDNGDVSWLEQRGTTASEALLMRYDAMTMTSSLVDFPNATRQGYQTMNANGDIVWNAVVADNQQVLLYEAATGTMSNLSNNEGAINSNQRIMNNGDVVWDAYDLLAYKTSIMYYKAEDQSVTQVNDDVGAHLFGSNGNIAWVSNTNGVSTITTYDPATGIVKDIATQNAIYGPNLAGINARGDVAWSVIIGTSWLSRVYNANTDTIVDLTNTQGSGTYDLDLADNGDVVWSLWDGTDYEVHTYQSDSGAMTQLSDNQVDDGFTAINGAGTVLWERFDPSGSELMLAVRNTQSLKIDVKDVDLDLRKSELGVKSDFQYSGIPGPADAIAISLDGISLVNTPFGDFTAEGNGIYKYKTGDTDVKINFNSGKIKAEKDNIRFAARRARSTVEVSISFGQASAVDFYTLR